MDDSGGRGGRAGGRHGRRRPASGARRRIGRGQQLKKARRGVLHRQILKVVPVVRQERNGAVPTALFVAQVLSHPHPQARAVVGDQAGGRVGPVRKRGAVRKGLLDGMQGRLCGVGGRRLQPREQVHGKLAVEVNLNATHGGVHGRPVEVDRPASPRQLLDGVEEGRKALLEGVLQLRVPAHFAAHVRPPTHALGRLRGGLPEPLPDLLGLHEPLVGGLHRGREEGRKQRRPVLFGAGGGHHQEVEMARSTTGRARTRRNKRGPSMSKIGLPFSKCHRTHIVPDRPATSRQPKTMPLDELSEHLQLSKQTLVRWTDRHLIDADLYWSLSDANEEIRMIDLTDETLDFLEDFAADYREDVVSRTEARRILKQIDRKKIKKLIRAGDVEDVEVDEETRVVVGSLEDYLMRRERVEEEEDDE
ncbi:hypothetical protein SRU_1309 [Salinibacter ruber DSM 13855]|uniref:Uncharacterized protein n=2 Tax=Salinibacter ruber TaxID=146919 RepID=Q2S2Z8_SALRD|nr:hypothetical protein SRU_1309 [Salinibacter ruber DSM 13855]